MTNDVFQTELLEFIIDILNTNNNVMNRLLTKNKHDSEDFAYLKIKYLFYFQESTRYSTTNMNNVVYYMDDFNYSLFEKNHYVCNKSTVVLYLNKRPGGIKTNKTVNRLLINLIVC
jgi:hypothetical protein